MTASSKLRFLADTVLAESEHLQTTDGRLFGVPMTPERAAGLRTDIDLAEPTDAFVAHFGRLQDTVADKLLPALLDGLAEPGGGAGAGEASAGASSARWWQCLYFLPLPQGQGSLRPG